MAEIKAEVEVKDKEETKETEKKKGGFWSGIKKSFSDTNREAKIQSSWDKNHDEVEIYEGCGLFNLQSFMGEINKENMTVTILGEIDIPYSSVLVKRPKNTNTELPEFYYVIKCQSSSDTMVKVKITEDDKEVEYERQATILTLDKNIHEIKVVKVKDTYFPLKEEVK
ncbi:MAG: hypothetical protein WCR67_04105 [Bacilli bacterium]